MKRTDMEKNARRKFLTLGILGGATLLTRNAYAQRIREEEEMVPMLTADGQLVHVPKNTITESDARTQVKNKDILKWTRAGEKPVK